MTNSDYEKESIGRALSTESLNQIESLCQQPENPTNELKSLMRRNIANIDNEAASIAAARTSAKFEGEHRLAQCDKAIAVLEESLARLQAERREIVNRYDLNKEKSKQCRRNMNGSDAHFCHECCKDDDQHAHMVD